MMTKILVGVLVALGATAGGVYLASANAAPKNCCFPGSECCYTGSPCCAAPVAVAAPDCCFPGSPCCEAQETCCLNQPVVAPDCCFPGSVCCDDQSTCCLTAKPAAVAAKKSCCEAAK